MIYVLSGCKRSGKDTCFEILKEMWEAQGVRVARFAFADALREVCAIVFGFTDEDFSDGDRKDSVPSPIQEIAWTPRRALQFVGTELFRDKVDPDVWVHVARHRIRNLLKECDVVVVTDARFPNEIHLCKEMDKCCSVFVARPAHMPRTCTHESELFTQMIEAKAVLNHEDDSAMFLPNDIFDYILFNTDLERLRRTLSVTFPIPPSPVCGFAKTPTTKVANNY